MGTGIDGMIAIARAVAAWTPGGGALGHPRLAGTLTIVAGGLWLALWRGRVRLVGIPVTAVGILLSPAPPAFDLVVAGDGRGALLTRPGGGYALLGKPDDFEAGLWLAALGETVDPDDASLALGTACDRDACLLWADGQAKTARASLVFRPIAFADECAGAKLVITPLQAPPWCRRATRVIDASDLEGTGARTYRIDESDGDEPLGLVPVDRSVPAARRPWSGG